MDHSNQYAVMLDSGLSRQLGKELGERLNHEVGNTCITNDVHAASAHQLSNDRGGVDASSHHLPGLDLTGDHAVATRGGAGVEQRGSAGEESRGGAGVEQRGSAGEESRGGAGVE